MLRKPYGIWLSKAYPSFSSRYVIVFGLWMSYRSQSCSRNMLGNMSTRYCRNWIALHMTLENWCPEASSSWDHCMGVLENGDAWVLLHVHTLGREFCVNSRDNLDETSCVWGPWAGICRYPYGNTSQELLEQSAGGSAWSNDRRDTICGLRSEIWTTGCFLFSFSCRRFIPTEAVG